MPRLAAIKLEGRWQGPRPLTLRSVSVFSAGLVLIAGAAIAGATWLGGSLFDVNRAVSAHSDRTALALGLEAHIDVEGVTGARANEIRALALPEDRLSMLAADPHIVQARVESLDWVQNAQVRRLWPNRLHIIVERRAAFARWQENGVVSVVDAAGERLLAERAANHANLPLIVGAGASRAAEPVLRALEDLPEVRSRLSALVRVGERRWNVEMRNGATIALPEDGAVPALVQLEAMHRRHAILDRPLAFVDLRVPGRMVVRPGAPLLGAPALQVGNA